jgi:Integral membrane protein (PIN domain superfamily)
MAKNIARFFITLMGLFVGPGIVLLVFQLMQQIGGANGYAPDAQWPWLEPLIYIISGIVSGIIFLFLSKPIVGFIFKSAGRVDKKIARLPSGVIMPAVIGLILGLVVAYLLSHLVNFIPFGWIAGIVNVVVYIVCVYLGISIFVRHKPELPEMFKRHRDEKGRTIPPRGQSCSIRA